MEVWMDGWVGGCYSLPRDEECVSGVDAPLVCDPNSLDLGSCVLTR